MKDFVVYLLKSGICISLFLLIYQLFLRKTTFFHFNRVYLMFGMLASVVIPMIKITYDVPIAMTIPQTISNDTLQVAVTENSGIGIWTLVLIVYVIGVFLLVLRNVFAFRKLSDLKKGGKIQRENGYRIVDCVDVKSPFSVLNYVMVNSHCMSDTEKDLILKHELTHINQKHWIDLFCSECMLMLQWFNPFMWIYVILQKENHEFLADKAVIDEGISPAVYQAVLINQQFRGPVFSFSNSFNYSNHLNRLIMIKKRKSAAWKRLAALMVVPVFGVFFWVSAQPRYVAEEFVMTNIPVATNDSVPVITINNKVGNKSMVLVKDDLTLSADSIMFNDGTGSNVILLGKNSMLKNKDGHDFIYSSDSLVIKRGVERPQLGHGNGLSLIIVEIDDEPDALSKTSSEKGNDIFIPKDKVTVGGYRGNGDNEIVVVNSKKQLEKNRKGNFIPNLAETNILIILDGKEITKEQMDAISPNDIEAISVLKDKSAIEAYGEKGKDGVIIITSKVKK